MTENESIYENTFSYIDDENLRNHMLDALEFISNLIPVSKKFPDKEKNYFYKTCILHIASIIESHIHFCLLKLWFDKYQSKNWTYKNIRELYVCNDGIKIMSGVREKELIDLKWNIDFNLLNECAYKKAWLYNEDIFKKVDKIRKLRNKIHLMKLGDIDRKYTKEQLDEVFAIAGELFKIIKKKIEK